MEENSKTKCLNCSYVKIEVLRKLTETRTNQKIIAITETHLFLAQPYDAEIAKYFHNYNIHRAKDCYQLLLEGGCMLLTSPDIVTQPLLIFSNGNCELLHRLYTTKNNCSVSIKEVLDRMQQYLTQKEDKENVNNFDRRMG